MPIRVLYKKVHDMSAGYHFCAQLIISGSRVKRFDHKNGDSSRSGIHNGYLAFAVALLPCVSCAAFGQITVKPTTTQSDCPELGGTDTPGAALEGHSSGRYLDSQDSSAN